MRERLHLSGITGVAVLAIEAGILAVIVAFIAASQKPDAAALRERSRMLETASPGSATSWIEQAPMLFGGVVGLVVLVMGILMLTASRRS